MRTVVGILLMAGVAAAGLVQAQEHEHGDGAFIILRDAADDGRVLVGGLSHFGFALVDGEGMPVRHRDARFTLEQNGVVLLDTPATHEYDGLYSLDYTFTVPGPYKVTARSDGADEAVFEGLAELPEAPLGGVQVEVQPPAGLAAGQAGDLTITLKDADGNLVPHSDALVEVRRADDGLLVFRSHVHTHLDPMVLSLAFALPGAYEATVYGYQAFPSEKAAEFPTVVGKAGFTVGGPAPAAVPVVAPARAALPVPVLPVDNHGEEGSYVLSLITDPDDLDGPVNHLRLSALVYDVEAMKAVQHVNFEATVVGESGIPVFHSTSLHEYDGHLELVLAGLAPGRYTWHVKASQGAWSQEADCMGDLRGQATPWCFTIAPPASPLGAGPVMVQVEGADALKAGEPAAMTFALVWPGGILVPHSEVDLAILDPSGALLMLTKLHSHNEPAEALVTFPVPGEYTVLAEGDSLSPSASVFTDGGRPAGLSSVLRLQVGDGPGLPSWSAPLVQTEAPPAEPARTPGFGALAALAVLGLAALARARRP